MYLYQLSFSGNPHDIYSRLCAQLRPDIWWFITFDVITNSNNFTDKITGNHMGVTQK
jgi:hypothetical protein